MDNFYCYLGSPMGEFNILVIDIDVPKDVNVIVGQSHFIKTVEDVYEALITSCPGIEFGLAFCEASGDRLIRFDGNNQELIELAIKNAKKIAAGHTFIIYIRNAWPINVLNRLKNIQEITMIYCATANPLQIILIETNQGRGIIGVVDGFKPIGVEDEEKKRERIEFLRKIGYKKG